MADKYKIAIASTDGETVNEHFGRAEKFFIYVVDDDEGYDFVEERNLEPLCKGQSHSVLDMEKRVVNLKDCKYVAAAKIGPGAEAEISKQGLVSMELPGIIDDAVLKIWKYNQIQKLYQKI